MNAQKFIDVEKKYDDLKAKLSHGMITPAQMKAELKGMMILDDSDKYWMIGSQSGKWYVYENKAWVEEEPPHRKEKNLGILTDSKDKVPSYKSITSDKDEASENAKASKKLNIYDLHELEIKSVNISSLILFFGGIGIIIGIILGAVFGIFTDILPDSGKILPEMLQGIRGKVQGGIIFAVIGLVSGFICTTIFSVLFGVLFNFLCGFFGGVKFKIRN